MQRRQREAGGVVVDRVTAATEAFVLALAVLHVAGALGGRDERCLLLMQRLHLKQFVRDMLRSGRPE